jgi:hypothetical protein
MSDALRGRIEALAKVWGSGWGSAQTTVARMSMDHAARLRAALAETAPAAPSDEEPARRPPCRRCKGVPHYEDNCPTAPSGPDADGKDGK